MKTDEASDMEALRAECERHRRANLLRAVTEGLDPEWLVEAASTDFDRVPWLIIENLRGQNEHLRAAINEVGTECRLFAEGCEAHGWGRQHWCGGCVLAEALTERAERGLAKGER